MWNGNHEQSWWTAHNDKDVWTSSRSSWESWERDQTLHQWSHESDQSRYHNPWDGMNERSAELPRSFSLGCNRNETTANLDAPHMALNEKPWALVEIGLCHKEANDPHWVAQDELRRKLSCVLPVFKPKQPQTMPRCVVEWPSGMSADEGTHRSHFNKSGGRLLSCRGGSCDQRGDAHQSICDNVKGTGATSWAGLFDSSLFIHEQEPVLNGHSRGSSRPRRTNYQPEAETQNAIKSTAPHVCSSRIPRACKFMEDCWDPEKCGYCHDARAHAGDRHSNSKSHRLWSDGGNSSEDACKEDNRQAWNGGPLRAAPINTASFMQQREPVKKAQIRDEVVQRMIAAKSRNR